MPHHLPATEEARQSIVKQSEDATRLAELFAAASPLSDQQMVEITCPASARPGEHIEAQTVSGRMHVTIPDGVRPGQVFLVRRAPAVGRAHAEVEPPSYHPITDSIESRYLARFDHCPVLYPKEGRRAEPAYVRAHDARSFSFWAASITSIATTTLSQPIAQPPAALTAHSCASAITGRLADR